MRTAPRRLGTLVLVGLAVATTATAAPLQASAGFAGPATAPLGDRDDVWITLGSEASWQVASAFAEAGRYGAFSIEMPGPVTVARVREEDLAFISMALHEKRHRCGGFVAHLSRDEAYAAAERASQDGHLAIPAPIPYTIDNGPVVQALMAPLQEANIRNTITTLSSYQTRYHNCASGAQSATWIRDLWTSYGRHRSDVTVEFFTHSGYTTLQPSVILTIQGYLKPGEIVVLGAHQDSIAGTNCATSVSPGADDDASGIASLSEVIRVALAKGFRPQRTVKFMAYAAEEVGLRGSRQIAQAHQNQGANVVGVMQLDMTNYKGSAQDIYIYTDFTNAEQNAFIATLVDTYLAPLTRATSACGYGCSDHAAWTERGYPASFPFEAQFGQHSPFIHTSNDTLTQSGNNANHALKFAKLAAAYMVETAKGRLYGPYSQRP